MKSIIESAMSLQLTIRYHTLFLVDTPFTYMMLLEPFYWQYFLGVNPFWHPDVNI